MIGPCAWCGAPSIETVEIEPAQRKNVTMMSPYTGQMVVAPQIVKFAIYANVCEDHLNVCDREGGKPLRDPRRAQASVAQLDIYGNEVDLSRGPSRERKQGSAIGGER